MEKYHNMTGENYPHNFDGDLSKFNKEVEKQETKEPYKIGIGALFLWLLFVVLVVTILCQNMKIHELKDNVIKDKAKIEYLKVKVKILEHVSER